jgi:hypothetical protein
MTGTVVQLQLRGLFQSPTNGTNVQVGGAPACAPLGAASASANTAIASTRVVRVFGRLTCP